MRQEATLRIEAIDKALELWASRRHVLAAVLCAAAMLAPCTASAQICKPVSQRTSDVGCWIIAQEPVGQLAAAQTFWHLDAYPSRAAAALVVHPNSTVFLHEHE